jgi:hypothetical protein
MFLVNIDGDMGTVSYHQTRGTCKAGNESDSNLSGPLQYRQANSIREKWSKFWQKENCSTIG